MSRDFTLEIEIAKKEVIEHKRREWTKGGNHKYGQPFIEPKVNWFIATWETGFVVVDWDELKKVPKRKREKILALGGLS